MSSTPWCWRPSLPSPSPTVGGIRGRRDSWSSPARCSWALSLVGARFVHLDAQTRSMQQVTDLRSLVAERTPVDRPLLTPHLGLAVEADRDVVSGFEMGRFGRGPLDLSGKRGDELRGRLGGVIVVDEDLSDAGRTETLSWARGEFSPARVVEPYGQFGQRLWLFVPGEETLWAR